MDPSHCIDPCAAAELVAKRDSAHAAIDAEFDAQMSALAAAMEARRMALREEVRTQNITDACLLQQLRPHLVQQRLSASHSCIRAGRPGG